MIADVAASQLQHTAGVVACIISEVIVGFKSAIIRLAASPINPAEVLLRLSFSTSSLFFFHMLRPKSFLIVLYLSSALIFLRCMVTTIQGEKFRTLCSTIIYYEEDIKLDCMAA